LVIEPKNKIKDTDRKKHKATKDDYSLSYYCAADGMMAASNRFYLFRSLRV